MNNTLLLVVAVPALVFLYLSGKKKKFPPGPPKLPLLGNALQIPSERQWLTFTDWGKQYGEIVELSAFGQSIIILSSRKVITELLDRRGAIYSSRPSLPMAGELIGYEHSLPLAVYGPHHRECRKLLLSWLGGRKVDKLNTAQEEGALKFARWVERDPKQLFDHIRRLVATVVFKASHGHNVPEKGNDPLVDLAERATLEFSRTSAPGAYLVDLIPAMKMIPAWFPGAGWKKTAMACRSTMVQLRDEPFEKIKEAVKRGAAQHSFTEQIIRANLAPSPEEDMVQRWASTAFYSAGADTTVSAIKSFYLAMGLFPEIQARAQAEIDAVVGVNRLPKFSDRVKLPYLEKLIREVLRWNPVAPIALPHMLTQDDVYEGYHLPKGSMVFANSWGIMHDPSVYPSPFEFNPDRYDDTETEGLNPDPRAFAFGYGRRVCPGEALADASLYITAVTTLSLFNVTNPVDDQGQPLPSKNVPYTPGVICHPESFKCSISLRSPEHRARLE